MDTRRCFAGLKLFSSTLPSFPHSHSVRPRGRVLTHTYDPVVFPVRCSEQGERKLCRTRMLPARTLILGWFTGKPDATCPRRKEETKRRRQPCSLGSPARREPDPGDGVRGEAGGKVGGGGRQGETWALCFADAFRRATSCDEFPVLIPPHSFHLS